MNKIDPLSADSKSAAASLKAGARMSKADGWAADSRRKLALESI
jgi:hypothetical protein